jgi:SM-20-related protein
LETKFEELIQSYLDNNLGLVNNFLSEELAHALKENILLLYKEKRLKEAGIGNNAKLVGNKEIRSDMIFWLDRNQGNPIVNSFFDVIDAYVKYMNETCYAGITGYEFHYAFYEEGSFYKRHVDQFQNNQGREFSMITYLNDNWQEGDGGELCLYLENEERKINPIFGRSVLFKSREIEHEVLLSHKNRLSLTGWFKVGYS